MSEQNATLETGASNVISYDRPCAGQCRGQTGRPGGAPAGSAGRRHDGPLAGVRARSVLAVEALGELAAANALQIAAVADELAAAGPVARHLAETVGCAMLRAARAERLEGELLAGLAERGGSVAGALLDDPAARATLALIQSYRRGADLELRRALATLAALVKARSEQIAVDAGTAELIEEELDSGLAALPRPSEPRMAKIVTDQKDTGRDRSLATLRGAALIAFWQRVSGCSEVERRHFWALLDETQHMEIAAAAEAQVQRAGALPPVVML